jgi:hypothetical protein
MFSPDGVNRGSKCAVRFRRAMERITRLYKLEPTNPTVEGGYDDAYKDEHKLLDYYVLYKGKRIAMVDITCSSFQLLDYNAPHYSKIMPVKEYKGNIVKCSELPIAIVINMLDEECYGLPFKNRCLWIKDKNVIKAPKTPPAGSPAPEIQVNYYTDIKDWHRGLDSLIQWFREIKRET